MDTQTGRIYQPEEMQHALYDPAPTPSARELRRKVESGAVVPVSPEVVQKMLLGERELRRRKRRQQRDARKHNR